MSAFLADHRSLESQLRQLFNVVKHQLTVGPFQFRMLHPRSADELIDEAEFNRDERLPYWAEIWPSAFVLAGRIAEFAQAIQAQGLQPLGLGDTSGMRQPRLLELGCGCGLAVMSALSAGFSVTAVDYYPEALDFVRLNAVFNGLPLPETRTVDWRNYPNDLVEFDMVVAADVLYERDYCRLIAGAFRQSLRPGGLGLLTDPQRIKAEAFPDECVRAGLHIRGPQVSGPLGVPGGDPGVRQTVNLFDIQRPASRAI
ncbi:MAG TPA: class I SAM-dependent methyltransferase [Pirellulales bacterium]|nr:class I SAM-dependent methyltransferase [Pirellulales bacterium]